MVEARADWARGFTPDSKNILFASQRHVFTNRYHQLFTVPVTGGFPTQLGIPNACNGVFSPDGKKRLTFIAMIPDVSFCAS